MDKAILESAPPGRTQAPDPNDLVRWVVEEGRAAPDVATLLDSVCEQSVRSGIPITRASWHLRTLHPELLARTFIWRIGEGVSEFPRSRSTLTEPGYLASPIYAILSGAAGFRRRLEDPAVPLDFPILSDLKAEGATDYVAMELVFTSGKRNTVTWATDRPGGFTTAQLTALDAMLPHLALILEIHSARDTARTLMSVYLGDDAATRVLNGQVTRGSGEVINAAILFADMRDFTAFSENQDGAAVIATLNQYFECLVAPVEEAGGVVLKFMGDGLLAIFRVEESSESNSCTRALRAAQQAFANLKDLNRRRTERGDSAIRMGLTFHVGEVVYGNIGATKRLDFTVIGPAVNLVSRLQGLCRPLNTDMLMSTEFARAAKTALVSLGFHELRGVAKPVEVFALPRPTYNSICEAAPI
jgi:adenylate cyclase